MKIPNAIRKMLSRWPANGLRHNTGIAPGKPFDPKKSEVCEWLLEQAEAHSLIFDLMRSRGWISYIDGAWRPCAADTEPVARGNTGVSKRVAQLCPPELALWVLGQQENAAARWAKWQKACEEEAGAEKKWGKWAFFHAAVRPLSLAEDITKNNTGEWVALREVEERPEVKEPTDAEGEPEPDPRGDALRRRALGIMPATEAAIAAKLKIPMADIFGLLAPLEDSGAANWDEIAPNVRKWTAVARKPAAVSPEPETLDL